jgi:hypothetical protein
MVLVFSSLGSFKPNLSAICNSLCDLNVTSASMRRLMTVNCRAWFDLNGLDVQALMNIRTVQTKHLRNLQHVL